MNYSIKKSHILTTLIEKDFYHLNQKHEVQKYLSQLSQVTQEGTDSLSKVWAYYVRPQVPIKNDGPFRLNILYLSQADQGTKAVVQFTIIENATGNTVEEFARYYELNDLL